MDDAQERDWAERRSTGWSSEDVFESVRARAETLLVAWGRFRPSVKAARAPVADAAALRPQAPDADVAAAQARLARMIQAEVVPRLMLAHRGALGGQEEEAPFAPAPCGAERSEAPAKAENELAKAVETLAQEALRTDAPALSEIVRARQAAGLSPEQTLLELIAPAARRIGEFWESDERDFLEVTIALTRLHAVAREVARGGMETEAPAQGPSGPVAVAASAPGEQHVLGALMVAELLRRRGASVVEAYPATLADLRAAIVGRPVDLVCLSLTKTPAGPEAVAALRQAVAAARAAAPDHAVILVGGRAVEQDPDLAVEIGAVACDAHSLGGYVEQWLGGTVGRC